MPAKAPSSLSRDKASRIPDIGRGVESILGKRKSQQRPPASTKRNATTFPRDDEDELNDEVRSYTCSDSPSSSSDVDEHERIENDKRTEASKAVDILSIKPTSRLSPVSDRRYAPFGGRKHTFETRLIRRRQSTSTLEYSNNVAGETGDTAHGKDTGWVASSSQQNSNLAIPIVYRIECAEPGNKSRRHETFLFEDDPLTANFTDGRQSSHLSGKKPIYQLQNYVRRFQQLSFVIIKSRQCGGQQGLTLPQSERDEIMLILNDDLRQAIQKVATFPLENFLNNGFLEIRAPYQLLYFHRELLRTYSQSVNIPLRREIEAVLQYIVTIYGNEYAEAEELLSQDQITIRHRDKVFRPNQLVVSLHGEFEDGQPDFGQVYVLRDWPTVEGTLLNFSVWSWKFNGWKSYRTNGGFGFAASVEDETESFPIQHLGFFPMSVLSKESIESLRRRGKNSWDLRQPNFVYCTGNDRVKPGRYMIDHLMYAKLHSQHIGLSEFGIRNKQTDPWRLSLNYPEKPTEDEFFMMPTEVPGYDLLEKEWVNLPVSKIMPIRWSKLPFEDLVLPEETKRLVRAMVTVRASSIKAKREEQLHANFDIIPGKGNGLIMLFHGSPGTGKTLTAESVAEIAEMPLYPITCGDIGTEPDKVEQYLQLVFELGKRWNCVLLLDEADVFLEERTLTDLQRNSLVSVFLRMLEYYEGILILTSNRVGTFDEAFRSRIHIALHYEDLRPRSRKQIWLNFLGRLEGTEDGDNVDEIKDRLDELANHKLNGREIRNALSTARQLASHEGRKMGWDHLELAIKTADKFGKYLRDVHGHSDRDWAKERKERL